MVIIMFLLGIKSQKMLFTILQLIRLQTLINKITREVYLITPMIKKFSCNWNETLML